MFVFNIGSYHGLYLEQSHRTATRLEGKEAGRFPSQQSGAWGQSPILWAPDKSQSLPSSGS